MKSQDVVLLESKNLCRRINQWIRILKKYNETPPIFEQEDQNSKEKIYFIDRLDTRIDHLHHAVVIEATLRPFARPDLPETIVLQFVQPEVPWKPSVLTAIVFRIMSTPFAHWEPDEEDENENSLQTG